MAKEWTPINKAHALNAELSHAQVAELTGYPEHAVRAKRQRLGVAPAVAVSSVDDDVKRHRSDYWKTQFTTLQRKYEAVLKEGSAVAQLVEMAEALAPQSYNPAPVIKQT